MATLILVVAQFVLPVIASSDVSSLLRLPSASAAAASYCGDGTVWAVDDKGSIANYNVNTATKTTEPAVPVSTGSANFKDNVITPDGLRMYAINWSDGNIYFWDRTSLGGAWGTRYTISMSYPGITNNVLGPEGMAIDSQGRLVIIGTGSNVVYVVDPAGIVGNTSKAATVLISAAKATASAGVSSYAGDVVFLADGSLLTVATGTHPADFSSYSNHFVIFKWDPATSTFANGVDVGIPWDADFNQGVGSIQGMTLVNGALYLAGQQKYLYTIREMPFLANAGENPEHRYNMDIVNIAGGEINPFALFGLGSRQEANAICSSDKIEVKKTASATPVSGPVAGEYTATWTITVKNNDTTWGSYGLLTDAPTITNGTITSASWTRTGGTTPSGSATGPGPYTLNSTNTPIPANATFTYTLRVKFTLSGNPGTCVASGGIRNSANLPPNDELYTVTDNSACRDDIPVPPSPATITKAFSPAAISSGEVTTMTITLGNPNNAAITGASFTDTYPSGLVNAPTPGVTSTCTGGTITASAGGTSLSYSGGTIPVGGCAITVKVTSTTFGSLTNTTGVVSSGNAGTGTTTGSATLAVQAPNFTVAKAVDKSTPIVGEVVTYTVTVTNNGPGSGTASLSDVVPSGVTVTDATCAPSTSCTVSRSNNSVSGTVTAGSGVVVTYTIKGTATTAGAITNTATVTPTTTGCTTALCGGGTASVGATIGDKPNFTVAKVADKGQHLIGETVVYTVTVQNTGAGAGTASLSDIVPSSVEVTSVSCAVTNGATCPVTNAAGNVSGTLSMPGGSTATVTIIGTAKTAGGVTNTANVTPTTSGCTVTNGVNSCGGGSSSVTTTIGNQPIFTQAKAVNDTTLIVGQPVTYTVTVTNAGLAAGTANVTDTVPGNITVSGVTCTTSAGGVCSTAGSTGNTLTGSVSLPASGTATFTITGTATTVGAGIINTANVTPTTPGCTGTSCGGGTASDPGVTITPAPFFTQTKTADKGQYSLGETITWTVTVENTGAAAGTASVTDTLPSQVTFTSVTCAVTGAGTCSTTSTTGAIAETVSLDPGAKTIYTINGTVTGPETTFSNTVTVEPTTQGCTTTNGTNTCGGGTATANTPSGPFFTYSKTVPRTSYLVGEQITYTILVTNSGAAAGKARVTDTVPATLTDVTTTCAPTGAGATCAPAGTVTGNTIDTTLTLPQGTSATLTVTGTATLPAGTTTGSAKNTVAIAGSSSTDVPCTTSCGSGSTTTPEVTVALPPKFTQTKTFDDTDASYLVGQAITYTVTVTNSGAAGEASVADTVPANVSVSSVSCGPASACIVSRNGNVVTGSVTLADGTTTPTVGTFTITGVVVATGSLVNTATITPATPNCTTALCGGGDATTDPVNAVNGPHFTQTKTVQKTAYLTGETVTYTVTVTNDGLADGTATVIDTVPATLTDVTMTCAPGASCAPATSSGNAVNTTVSVPAGASVTLTISGTATLPAGTVSGSATNTATITPTTADCLDTTVCGGGPATTPDVTITQAPFFTQSKIADQTAYLVGEPITYTITVTNTGEGTGRPTISDTVPSTVTATSVSCVADAGVTCDPQLSGNTLGGRFVMPGGTEAKITVVGIVASVGNLRNVATVTPTTPGCTTQCGGGEADTGDITSGANSLFTQVKTIDKTSIQVGETVTYRVTVTNSGAAGTATIADAVPSTIGSVTVSCLTVPAAPSASCDTTGSSGNTVAGNMSLPTNGVATYTITGTAIGVGSATNTADVTVTTPGCDQVDCGGGPASTPDATVEAPHFFGSKGADKPSYLVGETVTYTISVVNDGRGVGTARVTDSIPSLITPVSMTCATTLPGSGCNPATDADNQIDTLLTLVPNDVATITIIGKASTVGDVRNVATLAPTTPGCTTATTPGADCGGGELTTDTVAGEPAVIPVNPAPKFSQTKTADKTSYQLGETVVYTVTVTNPSPAGPGSATISDTVPATVQVSSVTCAVTGTDASCDTVGSAGQLVKGALWLPADGQATYTIRGTAVAVGSAVNTVTVTPTTDGCDKVACGGGEASTDPTEVLGPKFTQTKVADRTSYLVGETVTYTVTVTNTGTGVGSATVTDTVPSTITDVTVACVVTGAGSSCAPVSGTGNVIDGSVTLAAGGVATYTITGKAGSAGSAKNTVTVTPTTPGCIVNGVNGCGGGDASTPDVPVNLAPKFSQTKTADKASYQLGDTVVYTVTISNAAGAGAGTASVSDTVPSTVQVTGVACDPVDAAVCSVSHNNNVVSGSVTLAAGASATITITGTAVAVGSAKNTATVTPTTPGCQPGTTPGVTCGGGDAETPDTTVLAPKFTQTKAADKPSYLVGETVTYTVTVTNTGTGRGTASFTDTVPASVQVTGVACDPVDAAVCSVSNAGNGVSGSVTLAAGASVKVVITGTAVSAGSATNTVTVTPTTPGCTTATTPGVDCGGGDGSTPDVPVNLAPKFSQTKTADKASYQLGETVVYTVTVSNAVGAGAGTASVSDTVPSTVQVTGVACDPVDAAVCSVSRTGNVVSGSVTLAAGASVKITITGTAVAVGSAVNTATVTATTPGCQPGTTPGVACGGGDAVTPPTTVLAPNFTQAKSADKSSYLVGESVTYTVTVTNTGTGVGSATVKDTVPATITEVTVDCATTGVGSSCTPVTGTGNVIDGTVTLAPAGVATYTIKGKAGASGSATNTATITPTDPGCTTATTPGVDCGGGPATTPDTAVNEAPNFVGTKTANQTSYLVGQVVTYTITVTNDGKAAGTARVTDTVPGILSSVTTTCVATGTGSACTPAASTGNAVDVLVTLPAAGKATITVTGTTTAVGDARNVATIGYTGTGPTPGCTVAICGGGDFSTDTNVGDNTPIPVTSAPKLSQTKTTVGDRTAYIVGETVTYTVTVANAAGAGTATASISDTVPSTIGNVTVTCAPTGTGAACDMTGTTGNTVLGTVTLPAGTQAVYTITGVAQSAGSAKNTATVTGTNPGCTQAICGGGPATTPEITIGENPVLVGTKTADQTTYVIGDTVIYTVTITNTGKGAGTATMTDTVPASVPLSATVAPTCSGTNGATCTTDVDGQTVSGTASLPAGSSVSWTITGTATTTGGVTNTAIITPTTPGCARQCGGGEATVTTPTDNAPAFSATKKADKASAIVGESITYTVVVTNSGGPGHAMINDEVPAAVRVDAVSCETSTGGTCAVDHEGNTVSGDLSLPAGGTATYTIKGTAVAAGSAKNLATVATTGPGCTVGPMGGGKAVSVTCPVTEAETPEIPIADAPVFAVDKTAGKASYTTGETGTWTITVRNTGKGAGSAWVSDQVPAGAVVTGVTCTPVAPGTCDTSATKGQAVAATVVLPAGGSAVLVVTATMRDAGTFVNTASVQANTPGCSTQCGGGTASAPPVTVKAPAAAQAPLAFTGANVALMLGSALLLLVLGFVLVLLGRRSTYRRVA